MLCNILFVHYEWLLKLSLLLFTSNASLVDFLLLEYGVVPYASDAKESVSSIVLLLIEHLLI